MRSYTHKVIAGAIPPASLTQSGNVLTLSNATAGTAPYVLEIQRVVRLMEAFHH
jgi:hypothetical protein